jgi:hypothetical protein
MPPCIPNIGKGLKLWLTLQAIFGILFLYVLGHLVSDQRLNDRYLPIDLCQNVSWEECKFYNVGSLIPNGMALSWTRFAKYSLQVYSKPEALHHHVPPAAKVRWV